MISRKKPNLILIIIWPIFASLASFILKANFFVSILIFYGLPSVYLTYFKPGLISKLALYSLIAGVPFTVAMDYIMETTGGWFVPHSIFGNLRLFGWVTIDILVWSFLFWYFVTIFYEVFFEHEHVRKSYPNFKYLVAIAICYISIFIFTYFISPRSLQISYGYLKIATVFGLLPIIIVLFRFPRLYTKFLKTFVYFFVLTFIYELTAVSLGQWSFPETGKFIGWVQVLNVKFPLEELIFWFILSAMAILSWYEYFDDDRK